MGFREVGGVGWGLTRLLVSEKNMSRDVAWDC